MKRSVLKAIHLSSEVPNGDISNAKELIYSNKELAKIESLESFRSLQKLDMSKNQLKSLDFIEMNHELKWFSIANNRIRRLEFLSNLKNLVVLNVGFNNIIDLGGSGSASMIGSLHSLRNLILNDNQLTSITGIDPKNHPELQALVLSQNKLGPEVTVRGFKKLNKLSLAKNELTYFPKLQELPELSELKLNANKIMTLPEEIQFLPHLAILDLGNNPLTSVEPLKQNLKLKNLNVKGSPLEDQELGLHRLEILNFKRMIDKKKGKNEKGMKGNEKGDKGKGKGKDNGKGQYGNKGKGEGKGFQNYYLEEKENTIVSKKKPTNVSKEKKPYFPNETIGGASSSTTIPSGACTPLLSEPDRPTSLAKVPSILQRRLLGDKPPKKPKLDTTPLTTLPGNTKSQIVVHGRHSTGTHLAFESDDETFDAVPMAGRQQNDYCTDDELPSEEKKTSPPRKSMASNVSIQDKKISKSNKKLQALLRTASAAGLELTEQEAKQLLISQNKTSDSRRSSCVESRKSTTTAQSLKKVKKKSKHRDRAIDGALTSHHHVTITEGINEVIMTVQHGDTGTLEKEERMHSSKDISIPLTSETIVEKKNITRPKKKNSSKNKTIWNG